MFTVQKSVADVVVPDDVDCHIASQAMGDEDCKRQQTLDHTGKTKTKNRLNYNYILV